jgi:hypothetical protein
VVIGLDTVEPTNQKGCDQWDGENEQKVTERHGITQSNYRLKVIRLEYVPREVAPEFWTLRFHFLYDAHGLNLRQPPVQFG